jgi:hypothetical protein
MPELLFQPINPVSFFQPDKALGAIDLNVGYTPRRDVELEILEKVGSYGRQIGRIAEAVEVLTRYLPREILDEASRDAIDALRQQVADVRAIKERVGARSAAAARIDADAVDA